MARKMHLKDRKFPGLDPFMAKKYILSACGTDIERRFITENEAQVTCKKCQGILDGTWPPAAAASHG